MTNTPTPMDKKQTADSNFPKCKCELPELHQADGLFLVCSKCDGIVIQPVAGKMIPNSERFLENNFVVFGNTPVDEDSYVTIDIAKKYSRLRSEEVAVKFGFYVAVEMFAAMKGITRDKFLTEENRTSVMKTIMEQFNSPEFQQYLNETK